MPTITPAAAAAARRKQRADGLRAQGFDRTTIERASGMITVGCSQCEALFIQGVACHEQGCPNQHGGK